MIFTFPKIVKKLLTRFSKRDYRVPNSRLFVSCWWGLVLDKRLNNRRDLFRRLQAGGVTMNLATFSKANKVRGLELFQELYQEALQLVKQRFASAGITN